MFMYTHHFIKNQSKNEKLIKKQEIIRNYFQNNNKKIILVKKPEAATRGVLQKKLFLKISQYSQENNCIGISFKKS